jgi:hypothetical protein
VKSADATRLACIGIGEKSLAKGGELKAVRGALTAVKKEDKCPRCWNYKA